MLAKVREQALTAPPFTFDDQSVSAGPTHGATIVVGAGPWLLALAEFGRTRILLNEDVAFLRGHVVNPYLRDFIAPALLYQDQLISIDSGVSAWTDRLAALTTDARARDIEQAIIFADLAVRTRSRLDALLEKLRRARDKSQKPELRIALSILIIESQIARTRQSDVASLRPEG